MTKECPHYHWRCLGSTTVGFGDCFDCKMEIDLDDLVNNLYHQVGGLLEQIKIELIEIRKSKKRHSNKKRPK